MRGPDVRRNVFVVGLDDHHRRRMEHAAEVWGVTVLPLLRYDDVREAPSYDVDALLDQAETELDGFDGTVDAITTYWDFPSTVLAAILCERRGLATPGLRAVTTCEHKFWARVVQADVAPEEVPRFTAIDPFDRHLDRDAGDGRVLDYPFWLKPVKSYSSHLGFRIERPSDLEAALGVLRSRIGRLGEPFQTVMDRIEAQEGGGLPDEVGHVSGTHALAEGIIDGRQCTVEGHVHDGEVRVHGVFDIERAADGSTFTRYVYPSLLADDAVERMRRISDALMRRIGFDAGPFNIEFFVDGDRTWILEINPRISQEHTDLMGWVDGSTNLEVMVGTALGETPELDTRAGEHAVAGKAFHRHWGDAYVERAPTPGEVAELESRFSPCRIQVAAPEGARLSELEDQEPRSTVLAYVYAAAADAEELDHKLTAASDALPFELIDPG